MILTPRKDESSTTERRRLFNTTKIIEDVLRARGLIRRTTSENNIADTSKENIFYGKMERKKGPPRSRSLSLTSLVGEMTINKWNSNSSFEEKSTGTEAEKIIKTANLEMITHVGAQTPDRLKRRLSPNELTPIGRMRKMSTEVCNSPTLRRRYEYWTMCDDDKKKCVTGVTPVDAVVTLDPSTTSAEGRYGLVGGVDAVVKIDPSTTSVEGRYGLVGGVDGGCDNPLLGLNSPSFGQGNAGRKLKTPRRRLMSENVFDKMMMNHSPQTPKNRSNSFSARPRGGGRTRMVSSNQALISSFITPKRRQQTPGSGN